MRERVTDYIAWLIAKLVSPVYKNKEKFTVKKSIILFASFFTIIILSFSFGNDAKIQKDLSIDEIKVQEDEKVIAVNNEIKENADITLDIDKLGLDFLSVDDIDAIMLPVYAIEINGENKIFLKTEIEAESVINKLKNYYITEDENIEVINIYFEENVKIIKEYKSVIEISKLKTTDDALEFIIKGTDEERKHKIKSGENFWVLASDYDISVNNLIKANPDVVPERLQIGQEVSLIVPEPIINVCTVENVTYEEKIQYDVVYEDNANLYKDEYRVKLRGVYGEKEIEAELVKRDGRELGKVILNEEIISEPVTKIIYKGTKNPPPKIGTGSFSKPLNRGTITSGYGMRYHPVYRVLRKHTGVDIATSRGTSVLASDGGKVIFAGWKTGYGNCVVIDHGANLTSMYGHLSSINVSAGQKVYKGKTLGGVGSTGTSTGNHLHFEIRKLGNDINPNNYINLYNYY